MLRLSLYVLFWIERKIGEIFAYNSKDLRKKNYIKKSSYLTNKCNQSQGIVINCWMQLYILLANYPAFAVTLISVRQLTRANKEWTSIFLHEELPRMCIEPALYINAISRVNIFIRTKRTQSIGQLRLYIARLERNALSSFDRLWDLGTPRRQ